MFEQTFGPKRQGRRWRTPLVLAVVTHGAVLATAVLASSWSIDKVEPPLLVPDFINVAFPPPDLGGETPKRPAQTPPATPPASPPPVAETQPPVVPEDIPTAPAPPAVTDAPTDTTATDATGDGPTNPDGVPWGVPESPGDGSAVSDDVAVALDARMVPPQTLHRVQPRYPDRARLAGRQGIVVVQATIDRGGRVTDVRVVKGLGFGLDEAAVSAVQQWHFRPATLAGRPVPVYFQLSVQFIIH